jgi:hypothetical protein
MPVGRRYQVTSRTNDKTTFRIETGSDTVEILSPVKIAGGTPLPGKPKRYSISAPGVGVSSLLPSAVAQEPVGATRLEGGRYVVPVRVAEGARAHVAFQFRQPGMNGTMLLDAKQVTAEAPHLLLPDARARKEGTRAKASTWSLFGLDVGPGNHEVQFRPTGALKQGVLVLIDGRHDVSLARALEIIHEPVGARDVPALPQNWAWEARCVEQFSIPP